MHIKIKSSSDTEKEVVVPIDGLILKKYCNKKKEFVFSASSKHFFCNIDAEEYERISKILTQGDIK